MMEHRQGNRDRRRFGTSRDTILDERHGQLADGKDAAAKTTTTPNEDAQTSAVGRPSAFLEGSMHDRASAVPPTRFTADEALLDRYIQDGQPAEAVQAAPLMKPLPDPPRGAPTDELKHPDPSAKADKDGQRRSGIFRFGKSIASALSTASTKKKHDGEGLRGAKVYSFEDHRHRVERIYAEMKKDGRLPAPTVTTRARRTETGASVTQHKDSAVQPAVRTETASRWEPREQAGRHQTGKDDDKDLPGQPATEGEPIASPGAESTASHRNPFHFRKPSVPNLKKVKSGIHRLTSESLVSLGTAPAVPAVPGDDTDSAEPDHHQLRTQKSRKDLHRQQRLSKRVSNLEGKLLSARRELDEAMGQAQRPGLRPLPANTLTMKAFVGGTLPSLPSERLLLADKPAEHDKGGGSRGSFDERIAGVDAAAKTATSPLRIMNLGEGTDRSSPRGSNTTPGKRKSAGDHMARYETDEGREQSPAHPVSSPSKKRRVEAAPCPLPTDEHAQDTVERSLPRADSISSTLALTNEVAQFESALEPRPAVIQSIAEESMAVDAPSSAPSSSMRRLPQPAPSTSPATGLFTPRHTTGAATAKSDQSLSASTRPKGSKIPRRSISPPPPPLPPISPAATRQLRSRASMSGLESSVAASTSSSISASVGSPPSSSSSVGVRAEAGSLAAPARPTKKVLPRSPALHMTVGPPGVRGREGVVVLGTASSLGRSRRGLGVAVNGYGTNGNGNATASAVETETGNAAGPAVANATARDGAAGAGHGDTGDLHDRLINARAKLDGALDAVGVGSGVGIGSGIGVGPAATFDTGAGVGASVGASVGAGAGDDGFEWPDDVF